MQPVVFDVHNHLVEKKLDANRWWQAVQAKRIDVIAMTEHVEYDPIQSYRPVADLQPEKVVLIPGMELNTSIGHVIALAENDELYEIDELMKLGLPIERAIEIADKENITLSVAHPWGFKYDSAFHFIGDNGIHALVKKYPQLGVEAYNGMIGHLSFLAADSNWVHKPKNWFDFLEKNRVAQKTRLNKVSGLLQKKWDAKLWEIREKSEKALQLGEKAVFVTAGSDAHLLDQVGTGILKMQLAKKPKNARQALSALREKKKDIAWIGPYARENAAGEWEVERPNTTKKHIVEALAYAAKDFVLRKTRTKQKLAQLREKLRDRKREQRRKGKK